MIDQVNLAETMDEEELKTIGKTVYEEFEADDDSRGEWLEKHAKWVELYYQDDKPLNEPWEGSSQESMPLLTEACNQFHARAYKTMFSPSKIVSAVPVGQMDEFSEVRAKRVGTHMNWQLLTRDRTYKRNKDALLLSTALHGCCYTKVYPEFDPYRPRITNVRAEDLVVPYGIGPRLIEDLERKTEIIHISVDQTERDAVSGYLLHPAEPYASGDESAITEAHDRAQGLDEPNDLKGYPARLLEQHRYLSLTDGLSEPYIVTVDAQTKKVLRISGRYDVKDGKKIPVEYYTQYDFLRNPDGVYGLGMGHLVEKINTAVNKLLRQTVDASELANIGNMSGFISEALDIPGGEVEFQLGRFQKVRNTAGNITDGIYQFKFPGPQPMLAEIISALIQRSDRLATVTEALTGQADKVMQPTTILALIEQGLQIFSTVIGRLLESQQDELIKIYRLNRLHLKEREYFTVLDAGGALQGKNIAKIDYEDDLQVIPLADPNHATEQQKLSKAQAELEFARSSPIVMKNPNVLYGFEKSYLEALGTRNIDRLFPPPQRQKPNRIDDPELENIGALMPKPEVPPAYLDQKHQQHIQVHRKLLQSGVEMTPDGKKIMEAHIQEHVALLYGKTQTNALEKLSGREARLPGNEVVAKASSGGVAPGGAPGGVPQGGNGAAVPGGQPALPGPGTGGTPGQVG